MQLLICSLSCPQEVVRASSFSPNRDRKYHSRGPTACERERQISHLTWTPKIYILSRKPSCFARSQNPSADSTGGAAISFLGFPQDPQLPVEHIPLHPMLSFPMTGGPLCCLLFVCKATNSREETKDNITWPAGTGGVQRGRRKLCAPREAVSLPAHEKEL